MVDPRAFALPAVLSQFLMINDSKLFKIVRQQKKIMPAISLGPPPSTGRLVRHMLAVRTTILPIGERTSFRVALHLNNRSFKTFAGASDEAISPDGIIGPDGEVLMRAPLDPEESKRLWKKAIKAPMYSVGIAPVLVSATAAFVHTGAFFPLKTLGLCVASIAIIAWLNLSNDVFDSATGVDKTKEESVVNLTGDWKKVFLAANLFLIVGVSLLFSIISSVVRLLLMVHAQLPTLPPSVPSHCIKVSIII